MTDNVYKGLLNQVDSGEKAVIITALNNKEHENKNVPIKFLVTEESLINRAFDHRLNEMVYKKSAITLETGNLQFLKVDDEEAYLIEPYFPEPQLIVLGAGHIAKPLAEFGARAGFSVTVVDDRPSFANKERFPTANRIICEGFDKCFDRININEFSFVVIVTRGHRHDMDCLRQVLKYKTAYTGMIGSKRRVKGVMEQMRIEGFSEEKLNAVCSPIGLSIGAVTPEEIAFAIIAEVIGYRRFVHKKRADENGPKYKWPEFDREVAFELSKEEDSPRAIVTIVATKGSVPRKEGAKMLIWPFGKLLGSIGGGCSEGAVINNGRDVIRNGGYEFLRIDMTGEVAEDEGMVCGGIMDVVIEYFEK